ncbi:helix-turn-helix domain-containing protein [Marinactinospora rubrisoli]|uniref:Helix-turn-helix domain-containing protein n=1 Tax=Marinactinospora rubrisoli TaxID=2715399 RepID=A0ABW2KB94_9ACTN
MVDSDLRRQLFATVAETASLLRSDERTVRRAIEAGHIPAVKVSNKTLIPVAALLRLAGVDLDEAA